MTEFGQNPPSDATGRAQIPESTTGGGLTANQAAGHVAASATEQGRQVMAEAGYQARNLMHQARSEVTGQAGVQKKRAVEGLYAFGDELGKLAERSDRSGPATHLVNEASNRVGRAARWLDEREPGEVVAEVKAYARRNPGTFLLGAAVLGALAGRLTRGLMQEHEDRPAGDEVADDRAVGIATPPASAYRTQPTPGYPTAPAPAYPAPPTPEYPAPPAPAYPTQPTPGYPAQPTTPYPATGMPATPGMPGGQPPMGGPGPVDGEVPR